jgi:DNA mismatch repair protein MutS2
VRMARREIDAVIDGLKARAHTLAQEAAARHVVSTGDTGAARTDARAAVDAVVRRVLEPVTAASASDDMGTDGRPVSVGDRVLVSGLGLEAVVTGIHGGSADLDVRGKRMRTSLKELRVIGVAPAAATVNVHVQLQPRDATAVDLNVIGCSVDEALARAERSLDESLLNDQRTIRVIHGYGTGQLKRALAGFLQQHPLVARVATAPPDQGGGGVTVVELKD